MNSALSSRAMISRFVASRTRGPALIGVCAIALGGISAAAESTEDLTEVVVTANRRAQNVQDVPTSVAVISGDVLNKTGKSDVDEILENMPGVIVSAGANGSVWNIRGVTSSGGGGEIDPGISFSIDGIYNPFDSTPLMAYYDIDRVEVLRGPQGTLYGRNAVAGAINVITKNPNLDGFSGNVNAGLGNIGARSVTAAVNIPVTDEFALRVAGDTRSHNGYYTNGGGDQDLTSGRIKGLYQPSETTRLLFGLDAAHSGGVGNTDVFLPLNPTNPWDSDEVVGSEKVDQYGAFAQLDLDLSVGTFTFIPAYKNARQERYSTIGGSLPLTYNYVNNEQWTVEARLASRGESATQWVTGAFFYDNVQAFRILNPPDLTQNPLKTTSYAVFGELNQKFTDVLSAFAGVRYTKDHKSSTSISVSPPVTGTASTVSTDQKWDKLTWRAGVEFTPRENSLLYAAVSTGFKAGGTFPGDVTTDLSFDPENLLAYTIGSKNLFLDGRLLVNAEAYYYDYRDFQVIILGYVPAFGAVGRQVANAGKAHTYGAELDTTYRITRADTLNLSVGYFRGVYDDYIQPGNCFFPGCAPVATDFSGARIRNPAVTGNASYAHSLFFGNGASLTGSATIRGQSEVTRSLLPSQAALTHQGGFAKWDFDLTYDNDSKWSATAFFRNATNKVTTISAGQFQALQYAYLDSPRTYGVRLNVNF